MALFFGDEHYCAWQPLQYNILLFLDGLCGLNSEYLMRPKQSYHQGTAAREKALSK